MTEVEAGIGLGLAIGGSITIVVILVQTWIIRRRGKQIIEGLKKIIEQAERKE